MNLCYPVMGCLHCNGAYKSRASGLLGLSDGLLRESRAPHLTLPPWRAPTRQLSSSACTKQRSTGSAQNRRKGCKCRAAALQQVRTPYLTAGCLHAATHVAFADSAQDCLF